MDNILVFDKEKGKGYDIDFDTETGYVLCYEEVCESDMYGC